MTDFSKIFLSWRKGSGSGRHIVGVMEKTPTGQVVFEYLKDALADASDEGFSPYTGFPNTLIHYKQNVLEIFAQRLTRSERADIQSFYEFWEIEQRFQHDKFYLLGHTQGLLPTDNFEFLADYNPIPGLHFLTDLAGLSYSQVAPTIIREGDLLQYKFDGENKFDERAVSVFKDDVYLGHIKKIHCHVFHKPGGESLELKVKAFEKNGRIKKLFVKVYNTKY